MDTCRFEDQTTPAENLLEACLQKISKMILFEKQQIRADLLQHIEIPDLLEVCILRLHKHQRSFLSSIQADTHRILMMPCSVTKEVLQLEKTFGICPLLISKNEIGCDELMQAQQDLTRLGSYQPSWIQDALSEARDGKISTAECKKLAMAQRPAATQADQH